MKEEKAIQEKLEKEVTRLNLPFKGLTQRFCFVLPRLAPYVSRFLTLCATLHALCDSSYCVAAQEERQMLLGRLYEIETQLNAVSSNLPPSLIMRSVAGCGCVFGVVPRSRPPPV